MSRLTKLDREIHKQHRYFHKYLATGIFLGLANNQWTRQQGYPAHNRPNSLCVEGLLKTLEGLNQYED